EPKCWPPREAIPALLRLALAAQSDLEARVEAGLYLATELDLAPERIDHRVALGGAVHVELDQVNERGHGTQPSRHARSYRLSEPDAGDALEGERLTAMLDLGSALRREL